MGSSSNRAQRNGPRACTTSSPRSTGRTLEDKGLTAALHFRNVADETHDTRRAGRHRRPRPAGRLRRPLRAQGPRASPALGSEQGNCGPEVARRTRTTTRPLRGRRHDRPGCLRSARADRARHTGRRPFHRGALGTPKHGRPCSSVTSGRVTAAPTAINDRPSGVSRLVASQSDVIQTLRCTRCGKDRPLNRFRGRHKLLYEGRELLCRTCQTEWWRVRRPKR